MRRCVILRSLLTPALLLNLSGCGGDLVRYSTEEVNGDVNVQFINNTRFRAAFSYGTYDDLDRATPGEITLEQVRIEANEITSPNAINCARDLSIATQELVDRVIARRGDESSDFDADAFDSVVHFSAAAEDDPAAALPTVGTAVGVSLRIGVDFTCNDRVLVTFEEDPNSPGGFRVDYSVLVDEEPDANGAPPA